tara:strand:+ start:84 stop:371 length:288 start_codon:yes stop_codon:yes gene_type:complete
METIHQVENITRDKGLIHEFVKYNNKTFKLIAGLENGRSSLEAQIMDGNGVFQFIIGKHDVEFEYSASYVSDIVSKQRDLLRALTQLKKIIKIIY